MTRFAQEVEIEPVLSEMMEEHIMLVQRVSVNSESSIDCGLWDQIWRHGFWKTLTAATVRPTSDVTAVNAYSQWVNGHELRG